MTDDQDWTDPAFVAGAVLAQLEDLTPDQQRAVLIDCLAHLRQNAITRMLHEVEGT